MTSLGKYIEPPSTPEEVLDQRFLSVLDRVEQRRRFRSRAYAVSATVVIAVLGFLAFRGPYAETATNSTPIASSSVASPTTLGSGLHRLSDGSEVRLSSNSTLRIGSGSESGRHHLLSGEGYFHVAPQTHGEFVVLAADVAVRVIGTRFSVALEERSPRRSVRVHVDEGIVVVEVQGKATRLTAGDDFVHVEHEDDLNSSPPNSSENGTNGSGEAAKHTADKRRAASATSDSAPRTPDWFKEKFAEAMAARARGDRKAAIAKFREVAEADAKGSFGQLATLELGRLELGSAGDSERAVRYLEQSLEAKNSPLREENLARLVEAHERSGDRSKCRAARTQFLTEFPRSPLANKVRGRCPD